MSGRTPTATETSPIMARRRTGAPVKGNELRLTRTTSRATLLTLWPVLLTTNSCVVTRLPDGGAGRAQAQRYLGEAATGDRCAGSQHRQRGSSESQPLRRSQLR